MILTFDEITDHAQFEDLAVSYFEELKKTRKHNISDVEVNPSGVGTDGGRDILAKIKVSDGLFTFPRTWVVQCKFHESAISTTEISDINIPSLVHSYKADGYLLICRSKPTSKLTSFLENLDSSCKFSYLYKCWYGDPFLIKLRDHPRLLEKYFPKYNRYIHTLKSKTK